MDAVRIASFPHYSYLPQYVAEARQDFLHEDIDVQFTVPKGSWSELLSMPMEDGADIVLGNVWFSLQTALQPHLLTPIANCAKECRFVLTSRQPRRVFRWTDLEECVLLVPSEVPTPWVALRAVLKSRGVSLEAVRLLVGYTYSDAVRDFLNGLGDFLLLDLDRAQDDRLVEVAALATELGPVPWSLFFARTTDLERRPRLFRRFQAAIARAQAWIWDNDPDAIAKTVAPWFRTVDAGRSARTIERYKALNIWARSPLIALQDVRRWQDVLLECGLQSAPQPLEQLIAFANSYRPGGVTAQ